jgi:DNA-directed RNA polymerase specialized sigma24 family protein
VQAFTLIFMRLEGEMKSFALGKLRFDDARALDAVQIWGERLWRNLDRLLEPQKVVSFGYTMMRFVLADLGRAERRWPSANETDHEPAAPTPPRVRTTLRAWWLRQTKELTEHECSLLLLGASVEDGELGWVDVARQMNEATGETLQGDAWRKRYNKLRERMVVRAKRDLG